MMEFDCFRHKKVLITGHTGFKGSWLAKWLEMLGAETYGISLESDTQPNHYDLLNLSIHSTILDIRDFKKLKSVLNEINPDIIFHLAAQPLVRQSYQDPLGTFATNVMGTANILNSSRELKNLKAVIVITTDKCYENKEIDCAYQETDPLGGYDPYSASKGCAELVVSSFRNSFFNLENYGKTHQVLIASARAGNVVGGGDWAKDRLIPDIVRAVVKGETVNIRNPKATRPWQHVLDCLSGYLCLAEKLFLGEKSFASAWNFAPQNDGIAVLEIVKLMQDEWPKINYQIEKNHLHPHEAHLLKLDSTKANTRLKWQTVLSLPETIKITADWYRDFYEKQKINTFEDIQSYVEKARKQLLTWCK